MKTRYILIALLCFALIGLLLIADRFFTEEPEPIEPPERDWGGLRVQQMVAEPEYEMYFSEDDVIAMAKILWGEARGNAQIVDAARKGNVKISGNARVVYNPSNIDEYIDFYGLEPTESTVRLFKAVHFTGEKYYSDADHDFIYTIGDVAVPTNGFNNNIKETCGAGINLANKAWALNYGYIWYDPAILELECEKADVLVPLMSDGKVRARKAKVIREVPLEECGLLGKMLAKQRAKQ